MLAIRKKKNKNTETVQLINFSRGLPFTGRGRFQKKIVRFERRPAAAAGPAWSAGRSTRAEAAAWPVVASSAGRSTRETATWPVASAGRSQPRKLALARSVTHTPVADTSADTMYKYCDQCRVFRLDLASHEADAPRLDHIISSQRERERRREREIYIYIERERV